VHLYYQNEFDTNDGASEALKCACCITRMNLIQMMAPRRHCFCNNVSYGTSEQVVIWVDTRYGTIEIPTSKILI
jgi:hypothetical protein